MMAALRVWFLGLLAVAAWLLASYGAPAPVPLRPDAASEQFSAARADVALARLLGAQKPHPAGTPENQVLHARLLDELSRLGTPAQTITGMSCLSRHSAISCGTVSDIIAEAVPGDGKAILLMAHLDSVAAGPGAGDDASGVAILLETIRALKAGGDNRHPVIVLFSDGEELGLLGATLFLSHPEWRGRIGVVINVEARGNHGPSYLFQTSAGDENLIDLYARSAAHPATSSFYDEIYKYLPNDTDLTLFLQAGFAGYNFAFIGNEAEYHSPRDTIGNLDPVSLQSQGDNVLGLVRGLEGADYAELKGGDAIYFDVLHNWLPRVAKIFALPLALASFIAIALAGWLNRRHRPKLRRPLAAQLVPPFLLLGCVAMGFALAALAGLISGESDPAFAHPAALRIALCFGAWTIALLATRSAGATANWLWLAGLGIAAAIFAPGLSPYFIFPAMIAALLLLLTVGAGRTLALLLAALAALVVFIGFAASGEAIMGLSAHPLFTIPVALGLTALLPLMAAQKMGEGAQRASVLVSLFAALAAAVIAGFQPAYSINQPERLNLRYVQKDGQAWWLADPVTQLPASLRTAAAFSMTPQVAVAWRGYVASAGALSQLPAPSATVARAGNSVTLDLHGSQAADGMSLIVPAGLKAVTVGSVRVTAPQGRVLINCATPDCAGAHMVLDFSGPPPKSVALVEQRYGLPANGAFLLRARPDWAAPSGGGDVSAVATDVALPAQDGQ
jgi:hypothetical protein